MPVLPKTPRRNTSARRLSAAALIAMVGLAGCSVPDGVSEFNDPNEDRNRRIHAFNKQVDTAVLRPVGVAYAETIPAPVQESVTNLAENIELPGVVVNNLLQFDLAGATKNTVRFVINTAFGIGGLFDPADEMGLREEETDFGETLHVWGVPEGAYVELPLYGPSTERDSWGRFVDFFTNPLTNVLAPREALIARGVRITDTVGTRGRFAETVDSVLYDSADSYAQSRLLYLQNRRFELGQDDESVYFDPYQDPYEDPYAN